jgi:uncharacterized surface protein with fasciclin (FAS1) repeats
MNAATRKLAAAVSLATVFAISSPASAGSCGTHSASQHKASVETAGEIELAIFPLAGKAGFETLTAAIEAAGLSEVLTVEGPFTVFAPTDEAFAKLPEGTLEALLQDKDALRNILLYHVASGTVTASEVVKLESAETLNGQKVTINVDEGVMVNGAKVIQTDVMASNGVIHVIDTVLIPETL